MKLNEGLFICVQTLKTYVNAVVFCKLIIIDHKQNRNSHTELNAHNVILWPNGRGLMVRESDL